MSDLDDKTEKLEKSKEKSKKQNAERESDNSKKTDKEKPHGNRGRKVQRVKSDRKQSSSESLDLLGETGGSDSVSSAKGAVEKAKFKAEVPEVEEESLEEEPTLRKKVSKRTASVAALAAISDSTVKDEELEEAH